eukprot:TRINITY_DN11996_c0_g1_i1.p1 TRINITY_DN11996_c0_g1~~TRINITY_DN11996_c0_g1_i1.p1  ORF type:complete len:125 (-),score=30.48 TRINITY_DN11996_c0_g1_i1:102-476(-)
MCMLHASAARSARRLGGQHVAPVWGQVDIRIFRLHGQAFLHGPRCRIASHRVRIGNGAQDGELFFSQRHGTSSYAQQGRQLPVRKARIADGLMAATGITTEQRTARQVQQVCILGAGDFRTMTA